MVGIRPTSSSRRLAGLLTLAALVGSLVGTGVPAAVAGPPDLSEFPLPVQGSSPFAITAGPDGALWFTERGTDAIGRVQTDGSFSPSAPLPLGSDPTAIAAGPDGALWFTEQGSGLIGRLSTNGTLEEFPVPTDRSGPAGIAAGPDGALWFTERSGHRIGRIATDGTVVEYPIPTPMTGPVGIAVGADGNLWFTEQRANQIGRITTDGVVTEFPVPIASSLPTGIAAGADGALWFTMRAANMIGRIDIAGNVVTFPIPTAATDPTGIAAGWDGALWFTEPDVDAIGRITTDGAVTEFPLPQVGSSPFGIAGGPDDAVWFTEGNGDRIGRLSIPSEPEDTTPPTIAISAPVEGRAYLTGQRVDAAYRCLDEDGGSGLAGCTGTTAIGQPVDMSLGAHRFQVDASDLAGNTSTDSAGYVAFETIGGSLAWARRQFAGWPATLGLDMGRARLPRASSLVAPGFPQSRPVSCDDPSVALGPATSARATLVTLRDTLIALWWTDRAWAGTCRSLTLRFVTTGWTGADAVFLARF